MPQRRGLRVEGTVLDLLGDNRFRVGLANGTRVAATLSGEMRLGFIEVLPGSKVLLELSPYDLSSGRIIAKTNEEAPS